ncbi:hypothetical protein Q5O_20730 [Pseudomonas putida JB]|uniref:hypothetical protein n=1 Tax=Pseudomonas putida TaxID=303 RepID=UPI000878DE7C|nr:hypothetical protein [Pseudomonas putida]AOX10707.1 hypothetical protein Q5O_20730 [Pseudomonas putida JB]
MELECERLRVLISLSNGDPEQRHVGFVLGSDGNSQIIHMGWHKMLLNWNEVKYRERIGEFLVYECPHFNEDEVEELTSFISMLYKRYSGSMPYSIITDGLGEFFNLAGDIAVDKAGMGLTCATFLMSVLAVQSYPLFDEATWELRPDDEKWHRKIISHLRESRVDEEHVKAQEKFIGKAYRYRPEEVVGSANDYMGSPVGFCAAVAAGERVLGNLRQCGIMPA